MRYFKALTLIAIVCMATSCLVVPIPKRAGTRGPIREDALEFLKVGLAAREDVVFHLGIPESVTYEERIFDYKWIGAWEIGVLGPAGSGSWNKNTCHVLRFYFDERGIVEGLYSSSYNPKIPIKHNDECYFQIDAAKKLEILKY